MQTLLNNSKIEKNTLKNYIVRRTSYELSKLTEICHYPKLKKDYYEFLRMTGLTDKDIKVFIKRFYVDAKKAPMKIVDNPMANLLTFIMFYFLSIDDFQSFYYTMIYFNIHWYTNLINKQITFCNPDAFKYALENISRNHLFAREKSIANALLYLSKESLKKSEKNIKIGYVNGIVDFLVETRTRISQSIKSFAEIYYMSIEKKLIYKTVSDIPVEDKESEKMQYQPKIRGDIRFAEDIAKDICVYKSVDYKLLGESQHISKIQTSLASLVGRELNNIKYSDNIKIIILLFLKSVSENYNIICQDEFYTRVRKIVTIKRSKDQIYFKQQIQVLRTLILKELNYQEPFEKNLFTVDLFLAYYLTLLVRKKLCANR